MNRIAVSQMLTGILWRCMQLRRRIRRITCQLWRHEQLRVCRGYRRTTAASRSITSYGKNNSPRVAGGLLSFHRVIRIIENVDSECGNEITLSTGWDHWKFRREIKHSADVVIINTFSFVERRIDTQARSTHCGTAILFACPPGRTFFSTS